MHSSPLLFALGLTLFAGLSTGIGSLMAFFSNQFNPKFLAFTLGFSAGVMVYVSLIEIFPEARELLEVLYGERKGYVITTFAFFFGIGLMALIDKLIPNYENPHEIGNIIHEVPGEPGIDPRLMRMGLFSALAISIHNFPEGLATFIGAITDPHLGVSIAIAVAIHNIPEGIAISAPVYYATRSKKKAFWLSFLSGLSEPVGAVAGFFLLKTILSEAALGLIFAGVAGIMVYISLDELLPTAEEYGEHHIAMGGLVAGMIIMATSLILFT